MKLKRGLGAIMPSGQEIDRTVSTDPGAHTNTKPSYTSRLQNHACYSWPVNCQTAVYVSSFHKASCFNGQFKDKRLLEILKKLHL